MSWKDILKISTEDAISDAERFAGDEVNQAKREQILDVWRKMGFEIGPTTNEGEFAISPKKREPESMFDKHFYFLIAQQAGFGFIVDMPKVGAAGKFDKYTVRNTRDAKNIGERYQRRFDEAVETYNGDER